MKNYYEQMLKSVQQILVAKSPSLKLKSLAPQMTIVMLVSAASWWLMSSTRDMPDKSIEGEVLEHRLVESGLRESPSGKEMTNLALADCHECYLNINLSLDPSCERLITADLLLKNNALAISHPEYYQVRLTVGNGLIIANNTLKIQHVGKDITAMVSYVGPPPCPQGLACMTTISLKNEQEVNFIPLSPLTVYCFDPFLLKDPTANDYPRKPALLPGCGGLADGPYFGGDWVTIFDCVLGMQDTAKTIYRQWWAQSKDGQRNITFDTIYVLRLPPLSANNLYCTDKDTVYCGLSDSPVGPYLLVPNPMVASECDTIYLMDRYLQGAPIDPKCGLSVNVDSLIFQNTGCVSLKKYTVEIHQHCYGTDNSVCILPVGASNAVIEGGNGFPIYAACEFWLLDLDTMPPFITCNFEESNLSYPVICEDSFTLTYDYWKLHSALGPAQYDDTWALLPSGENTPFSSVVRHTIR
ncbi:MAG: hypothetical protein IPL46_25070 [Saprospiraceae bacterium]|nr:hypothetical protein [Saprospiraceae bacterium]